MIIFSGMPLVIGLDHWPVLITTIDRAKNRKTPATQNYIVIHISTTFYPSRLVHFDKKMLSLRRGTYPTFHATSITLSLFLHFLREMWGLFQFQFKWWWITQYGAPLQQNFKRLMRVPTVPLCNTQKAIFNLGLPPPATPPEYLKAFCKPIRRECICRRQMRMFKIKEENVCNR